MIGPSSYRSRPIWWDREDTIGHQFESDGCPEPATFCYLALLFLYHFLLHMTRNRSLLQSSRSLSTGTQPFTNILTGRTCRHHCIAGASTVSTFGPFFSIPCFLLNRWMIPLCFLLICFTDRKRSVQVGRCWGVCRTSCCLWGMNMACIFLRWGFDMGR